MNTAVLIIVFIVALIVSTGFLLIIISVVPAINQFKELMKDLQRASNQATNLITRLEIISEKIEVDLGKIDSVLDSSKETVETISDSLKFININILKKSAGLLAFIPAIKFGWKLVKKFKGGKKYA